MKNRFTHLWILAILLLAGFFSVLILDCTSQPINPGGGFLRRHKNLVQGGVQIFSGSTKQLYFVGLADSSIYVGDVLNPNRFLKYTGRNNRQDQQYTRISSLPQNQNLQAIVYYADSLGFFKIDKGALTMSYADDSMGSFSDFIKLKSVFSEIAPISPSSVAIVAVGRDGITLKKQIASREIETSGIIEPQVDRLFSTGGQLLYDRRLHVLVFVYTYRNQYLLIDTNLNLISKTYTIDTTTSAKLKIATVNEHTQTIASPDATVNKRVRIFRGHLYILSRVKADNESDEAFKTNSVIDVYDLSTNIYKYSFFLPDIDNNKAKDFIFSPTGVVARYEHGIYFFAFSVSPLLKCIVR